MITDRSPLTQDEIKAAKMEAAQMKPHPRAMMVFMLGKLGTDRGGQGDPGGCWERAVRQATRNAQTFPHLYRV